MNKLLSANFFRLRKNKCFRGSLAFMFVIGIASPLLRYRDMKQSGYINNLDNGFFMCALFIGIILAVFCSLFIGTEHNDGTIRNKIIVGQKRETIYLSNMVTCSIIAITMCIVFFVPYLSVGIPLLGFFVADLSDLPYYKRAVWFEMKRLCLSDYPKKQLEDFSRYVFGVPYAVIQKALTREDVMKHGRNACAD